MGAASLTTHDAPQCRPTAAIVMATAAVVTAAVVAAIAAVVMATTAAWTVPGRAPVGTLVKVGNVARLCPSCFDY